MGKIFYIMGKSAAGKDKIYKALLEDQELDLHRLVLYTTRPIRSGEVNGNEYFFVDNTKFQEMREQGKVIEFRSYQTVQGIWTYFTGDDGQMDLERWNLILEKRKYVRSIFRWKTDRGWRELCEERKNRRFHSMRKCADVFWQTV